MMLICKTVAIILIIVIIVVIYFLVIRPPQTNNGGGKRSLDAVAALKPFMISGGEALGQLTDSGSFQDLPSDSL